MRGASAPLIGLLVPVAVVAGATLLGWLVHLAGRATNAGLVDVSGKVYLAGGAAIAVAVVVGLALERLVMGEALATFAAQMAQSPKIDPELLLATTIGDPSLRIGYPRTIGAPLVDSNGFALRLPAEDADRSVAWVRRQTTPVAAVIYDAQLVDQERFVRAAGEIALLQLENAKLRADLRARTVEISASRTRLVDAADAERQRIERDLHDGVQQQVMGMRLRLDLARRALDDETGESRRLLSAIDRQMDDLLISVRRFARGIYPPLLTDRGLTEALQSAARQVPVAVSVSARDVGRCDKDIEVAVYFCCVEALQNAVKHAGAGTPVRLALFRRDGRLHFAVSDHGRGFDSEAPPSGAGLVNMRDRVESVGGELRIRSAPGRGTTVRGSVPLAAVS
jgi:signal transduction histidine kinase